MTASATLERPLEDAVHQELADGEVVKWYGQPRPWALARSALPTFLFGIPFFGFAVFWESMALLSATASPKHATASGSPDAIKWFFPLWGVPFLLIGLGMLLSPVWLRLRAARTLYVFTNRRVIVMTGTVLGARKIRSFQPDSLGAMSRTERSDGSGDLVFANVPLLMQPRNSTRTRTRPEGFMGIERVRDVERLVRQTLGVG